MRKLLFFWLFFVQFGALAQDMNTIKVVVNREVITQFDIHNRMQAYLRETGLKENSTTQSEVIRQLITETLQKQYTRAEGMIDQYNMVENRMQEIAKNNGQSVEQLEKEIIASGDDVQRLREYFNQRYRWAALLNREYYRNGQITDAQINERVEFLLSQKGKDQKLVQEIIIPFVKNVPKRELIANAAKLVGEFRAGRNFEGTAQTLKNQGLNDGSDPQWLFIDQLDYQFQDSVRNVRPGVIVGPAELADGVAILKVIAERKLDFDEKTINRTEIAQQLENEKRNQIEIRLNNQLMSEALIEYR